MEDKIKLNFNPESLQSFWKEIKDIISKYTEALKQPASERDLLLFEDVPMIDIVEPESISNKEEPKRTKAIPILSNPAYKKGPKIVGDGGRVE